MQSNIQKPSTDGQYIALLDGFRGLALLLVMAQHFVGFTTGWIGVDLFFVLSGFLVTWKLVQGINDPNYYLNFYWRRAVRIFPLYIAILVFVFFIFPLLVPSLITASYRDLLDIQTWYWTFTQNIYTARNSWPENISIIHLWSLAAEVQFYLVWPFVIRFFYKRPRQLTGVIIGLIVFAILFRLFASEFIPLSPLYRYVLLPGRIDAFTAGALLFILIHRYADRLKQILFWFAIAGTAVNVLLYGVLRIPINFTEHFASRFGYTLVDITWAAWMGYGLLAAKSNLIQQVFTKKALTNIGKYSYCMYIVHLPIWTMLNRLLQSKYGLQLKHEPVLLCIASLVITIVVYGIGYISYHTFERYFMRLKVPSLSGNLTHWQPRGR
jgi:peptidoglycan/LPS O-acetylase OafA/YrhL